MNLTERILSRWTGTGVRVLCTWTQDYGDDEKEMNCIHELGFTVASGIIESYKLPVDYNYKLLLRPNSDLTKEITHNGSDPFIPVQRLYELRYGLLGTNRKYQIVKNDYYVSCREVGTVRELTIRLDKNINDDAFYIGYNDYWTMQQLHEWHFDTMGLIEQGLAIDLNTIAKETA